MAVESVPDLEVTDSELFGGAMAQEAPEKGAEPDQAQPEERTPEPQTDDRQRDANGRFLPKEGQPAEAEAAPAEAKPEGEAQPDDDKAANVPSWRLREVREQREAAERRVEEASRQNAVLLQQMQDLQRQVSQFTAPRPKAEEPINFFDNPEDAIAQRLSSAVGPIAQQFQQLRQDLTLATSRNLQITLHGVEAVNEATEAVGKAMDARDPDIVGLRARMLQSDNPVGEVMDWHHQRRLNEIIKPFRGDMKAYEADILARALKDQTFLAKAMEAARGAATDNVSSGKTPGRVSLPPSLNRMSGSGSNVPDSDDADMSNEAMFRHASAPPQRGRR